MDHLHFVFNRYLQWRTDSEVIGGVRNPTAQKNTNTTGLLETMQLSKLNLKVGPGGRGPKTRSP